MAEGAWTDKGTCQVYKPCAYKSGGNSFQAEKMANVNIIGEGRVGGQIDKRS